MKLLAASIEFFSVSMGLVGSIFFVLLVGDSNIKSLSTCRASFSAVMCKDAELALQCKNANKFVD